jgi:hypothetical protein
MFVLGGFLQNSVSSDTCSRHVCRRQRTGKSCCSLQTQVLNYLWERFSLFNLFHDLVAAGNEWVVFGQTVVWILVFLLTDSETC